ncbi:MAG TPA: PfkB family carbohydrate kinase [Ramlibacter sp.]|jgi:nucleoside 2-deoxyribosyltransferase
MTVVGGIYKERCLHPSWNAVFGSAGRAAQAISPLVSGRKRLAAYVADRIRDEVDMLAMLTDFELLPTPCAEPITFDYAHTLADPLITPAMWRIVPQAPILIADENVLRYGMLEGDAVVRAGTAVYDPQSAFHGTSFTSNGSTADRLAVVLNTLEMRNITGTADADQGAEWFFDNDSAEVVVLKMGARGARVITRAGHHDVPLYKTKSVWKLGSGDVFSSTFAALWAVQRMPAPEAADLASRSVSWYCQNRSLPPPDPVTLSKLPMEPLLPANGRVYLAGPFFDLGQRWVIEEARLALLNAGVQVFSPIHEIGPGKAEDVASKDLEGLEGCQAVLAILNGMDPGTVFEVGYAKKMGIPVVALAENEREEDLKMMAGSGMTITDDFVTAIYRSVWCLGR